MKANNRQVGGSHYVAEFQHWDLVAYTGMTYFDAQITRYVGRSRKKNGLQDVEKALHYCDKYLELLDGGVLHPTVRDHKSCAVYLTRYCTANQLSNLEAMITELMVFSHGREEVVQAREMVEQLLKNLKMEEDSNEGGSGPTPAYVAQGGRNESRY